MNDSFRIDDSKCLIHCLLEKFNLLDDSNHIIMDKFKDHLIPILKSEQLDKVDGLSEMCPQINEKMDCDKARSLHKCIMKM